MSQGKKVEEEKKNDEKPKDLKEIKEIQKDTEVLKLLEEDEDDFEEFEEDAYDQNPPIKIEAKQWRQDWDDEDVNDDFANQLRKQLNL